MQSRTKLVIASAAAVTIGLLVAMSWRKPATTAAANAQAVTTRPIAQPSLAPSMADARTAALDWVSSTDGLLAMGTIERSAWIAAHVTPDALTAMAAALDDGIRRIGDRLPIPASELRLLEIPLTSSARMDGAEAIIEVWSVVVFGAERFGSPRVAWRTTILRLAVVDGEWRVASLADRAGPTPITGDILPSSWAEFATAASWSRATERGAS